MSPGSRLLLRSALICTILAAASKTVAQPAPCPCPPEEPKGPWVGSAAFGFSLNRGNTDTTNVNLTFDATYDPKTKNVWKFQGLYQQGSTDGEQTIDRLFLIGRRKTMKKRFVGVGVLACAWLFMPQPIGAQTGQRMSDNDVKEIIEAVDHARDRFEDQLDGNLKDSVVRGPNTEVKVSAYLDDLQENVKKLKERFNKSYAASAEAAVVLRQGSDIERFIRAQPKEIKGGSEWDTMAMDLGKLAAAYGTTFPLPEGATVRRINDGEAAAAADALAKQADALKKAIERDKTVLKEERAGVVTNLNELKKQANTVKSRTADSKPATSEARQVVDLADKVNGFFKGRQTQPATLQALGALRGPLDKVEQAFNIK